MGFDYRIYTGLGKQTLGGHKQNLVHTRTQEKGAVTPPETDPDLPVSVPESGGGVGWRWPAAGLGAPSEALRVWDLLKEVAIIFITPTIVWSQVRQQGGIQPHPSTENWIEDLLSMAPPIRISHKDGEFYPLLELFYFYFLFLFFSFIFISWRLITSQHFSGFCQTLT